MKDIAYGFFLLCHPIPILFHLIGVTLFILLAAWPHPMWNIILLVIAAHTAMQMSICMINDYCDHRVDAASKPKKPIPRGLIAPSEALTAGLIMILVMLLLLLPLNRLALLLSVAYLVLGQGYNLGLKSTPLSGIVFALAMPLIPLYAFAGVGRRSPILLWSVPMGLILGVALNLANSIPDIEGDEAAGAKTLAVVLGVKRSFLVCRFLIVADAVLMAILAGVGAVPARPWVLVPILIFTILSVSGMFLFFGPKKPAPTRTLHFYVATLTCIVLAGGSLIGVFV